MNADDKWTHDSRREAYKAMQHIRVLSNTEGQDREFWLKELESYRKWLEGMQYAPTPQEVPHKSELQHKSTSGLFQTCPKCSRLLHYSVISNVCYSCGRQ